jgi:hypothetical protein
MALTLLLVVNGLVRRMVRAVANAVGVQVIMTASLLAYVKCLCRKKLRVLSNGVLLASYYSNERDILTELWKKVKKHVAVNRVGLTFVD